MSYIFCNYCFAVVACHYFIIIFLFFFLFLLTPYCCCWCWLWLGINLQINCWLFSFRAAFLSMFENTTETKPPVAVPAPQNVAPLVEPSLRGKVSRITPLCCKPLPSLKYLLLPFRQANGGDKNPLGYRLVYRNSILEFVRSMNACILILCMTF